MKDKVLKYIIRIVFVIIAIMMLLFVNRHGLEIDELDWTLRVVDGKSWLEMFQDLALYGYNLPLYYIILKIVYMIVPLNKIFLIFPSIIFTLVGIYFIYKIAKELNGEINGLISILFTASSFFLYSQIAWQIRPYSLLFLLSAWSFYNYINKLKNDSKKNNVMYYISITLLLFTHWYGAIVVFFYGITDLVLLIKKKIRFKVFLFYIIPFILIMMWLGYVMKNHVITFTQYWPDVPDILSIVNLIINLFGIHTVFFIQTIAMIILFRILYKKIKNKEKIDLSAKIVIITLLYCIAIIMSIYFYSNCINPKSSLWVERYFVSILPQCIIIVSYSTSIIFNLIQKHYNELLGMIRCIMVVLIFIAPFVSIAFSYQYPTVNSFLSYEQIAEFLYEEEDVYDEDTLVICTYGKWWIDYYFLKRDIEVPKNIMCIDPYKYGNINSDNAKLDELEYVIKDSKCVEINSNLEDFSKYKKIYLIMQCRLLSDSELEKMINIEEYDYEENVDLRMIKFIKK